MEAGREPSATVGAGDSDESPPRIHSLRIQAGGLLGPFHPPVEGKRWTETTLPLTGSEGLFQSTSGLWKGQNSCGGKESGTSGCLGCLGEDREQNIGSFQCTRNPVSNGCERGPTLQWVTEVPFCSREVEFHRFSPILKLRKQGRRVPPPTPLYLTLTSSSLARTGARLAAHQWSDKVGVHAGSLNPPCVSVPRRPSGATVVGSVRRTFRPRTCAMGRWEPGAGESGEEVVHLHCDTRLRARNVPR